MPFSFSLSKLCFRAEQSNAHSQIVFTARFWIFQYEKYCNYVSYSFSHQCRAESSVPFRKLFSIIRKVSQKLFILIREAGTVKAVNSASSPKTNGAFLRPLVGFSREQGTEGRVCGTTGADGTVLMPLAWQGWCFASESPALGPFPVVFAVNCPEGAGSPPHGDRSELSPSLAGRIRLHFG